MTSPTVDWIDQAAKAGVELRALIREAHEATRDIKTERKLLDEKWGEIHLDIMKEIRLIVEKTVEREVNQMTETIGEARDASVAVVVKGFERLADTLKGKDADGPTIEEMVMGYKVAVILRDPVIMAKFNALRPPREL
jgi:hypothetical protein